MCAQRRASLGAEALDDVHHAWGKSRLRCQRSEQVRRHRSHLRRLGDHAVSRGQRRGDLPREQIEREVPGRDAGDGAERLPQRVVERHFVGRVRLAGELRDRVGEEVEVLDGARDVHRARCGERLSGVDRFGARQGVEVAFDQPRQPPHQLRPLDGGSRRPGRKGAECRRDRAIHVAAVRARDPRMDLAGRRIDVVQPLAGGGGQLPSVDEVEDVLHPAELYRRTCAASRGCGRRYSSSAQAGAAPVWLIDAANWSRVARAAAPPSRRSSVSAAFPPQ